MSQIPKENWVRCFAKRLSRSWPVPTANQTTTSSGVRLETLPREQFDRV